MKKFLIFITMSLMFFGASAQMKTSVIPNGSTYVSVTTDYTLTDAVAQYWQINYQPEWYNAQSIVVNLDSLTGNHTNVAVAVYGRMSDQQGWTQIGSTINWKGTTADTVILFTNSTEAAYRQVKVLYTGTGTGTTKIDWQEFKFWNGLP